MDKIKIGLIGGGNVGGSIISDIQTSPYNITVQSVCLLRPEMPRQFPKVNIVADINSIINDPEINIIVECTQSPAVEQSVKELLENLPKKVFYINKAFYADNNIADTDWEKRKQAGTAVATEIISEILKHVSYNPADES
jgi:predicted dinucleotide-utilizing enzyme